ncbi:hypothetical protein EXIGLDRAFT_719655 [Exidia glandulosa HHB12029]|uniref:Thioredoxin-like fold domain-containing protein n=1 Tax=Exidia glandulosa HHB12029 TaxID=1314781 RepID=A0A165GWP5_EXIGL|nr:hypothetical protein EXIGLDRAFT_719655 [Exidia glandulosa HHB12029]
MAAAASIKLHGFPKADLNAPSDSYFCQKLEAYLRLASFPREQYKLVDALPFRQPKGKLPAITLSVAGQADAYLVDSHFIIAKLTREGVLKDVDAELGLAPLERADTRAWQAWTEDLVYPAIVATRWLRPVNYAVSRDSMPVPSLLRPLVGWIFYRRISSSLVAQGIGRHSDQEIDTLLKEWVDALAARLADGRTWFHASHESPSAADAYIGSLLANTGALDSNPEFNALCLSEPRIAAYAARCTKLFFPEYEKLIASFDTAC